MDLRVVDNQIQPLLARIWITNADLNPDQRAALADLGPWDDDGRLLAYTEEEQKALSSTLDSLSLHYEIQPEDQPDPALLASLLAQLPRPLTRTAVLDALAAGIPPLDSSPLASRLSAVESRLDALQSAAVSKGLLTEADLAAHLTQAEPIAAREPL